MRHLTVTRNKAFSGCLTKIKIYIEDPSSNEIVINGTNCRKLGEVKNGGDSTFVIGNESARIFVISSKATKGLCHDLYMIGEGENDVYLSGKISFDPTMGNIFRFDGNNTPEAFANRQKNSKSGMIFLICCAIAGMMIGAFIGFSGILNDLFAPEEKTFKVDDMSITLNENFSRTDEEDFAACFASSDVFVMIQKDEKEYYDDFDSVSIKELADYIAESNEDRNSRVVEKDGLIYCLYEYMPENEGITFVYYTYLYKAPNAFWLVYFCADKKTLSSEKSTAQYEEKFRNWAKSVKFDTENV